MAGQSGHNLKISKHRLGCRLPFETTKSDGDGYAKAGEVKIYHLTPEEIAARYGPPKERPPQRQHLTATHLLDAIAASSGPEDAAELLGMPVARFKTECTLRGIRRPQYGIPRKEADEMAAFEVYKSVYKSKEAQPDDDIIFMVPNKTDGKPVLKVEERRGITLNSFACKLFNGVEYLRIGVKSGRIILIPSTSTKGCFKLSNRGRAESTKIGGGGLAKQLIAAGIKIGKYNLVFNEDRGRWETVAP
jgi:hypothetical protein